MKITCDENGIVKWEEQGEIPDIPMELEITKLVPRERRLKERARVVPAPSISPDWYHINGRWYHITKSLNDKELYDDVYVNGMDVGLEGSKLLNDLLPMVKNINLLPKESTMKTRFAVVNLKEKVEFEKKWEMPYGYNNCPYIGFNQKEAIQWINQNLGPLEREEYVVERHKAGMIEVVWKIIPGHKLAGEEDEWEDEDF